MTVTLRPMTPTEFDTVIESAFTHFVAEMAAAGRVRADDIAAEARRQRERMLPDGLHTEHMLLFIAEVNGEPVGWIWLALPGAPHGHADAAWVFDIEVTEAHRGQGYGKAMMLAAEEEILRRGVTKLGLNVFGTNRTAITLYQRLWYEVISQQMLKPLTG